MRACVFSAPASEAFAAPEGSGVGLRAVEGVAYEAGLCPKYRTCCRSPDDRVGIGACRLWGSSCGQRGTATANATARLPRAGEL